jgi:DMSO/TMAO reductase YedYZ molybdopterin-dependent catalytic subunit
MAVNIPRQVLELARKTARFLAGPPPARPFRPGAFSSPVHHPRVAAILGIALGTAFTICFATGLLSDQAQVPQSWFNWPSRPRDLYRWTQGAHVVSGVSMIPLLLAKLWTVYPKLWRWPPFESVAHAIERIALIPLVAGALLLLLTGLQNIFYWYPTPFFFTTTHYWTAWIMAGALVIHVGAKIGVAAAALRRSGEASGSESDDGAAVAERRRFLGIVAAATGVVAVSYLGQVVSPLRALAVLTPRRSDRGVQGVPVNMNASRAEVIELAKDPGFRLSVEGAVATPLELDLEQLRARATHEADLPITCVEGWSVGARWRGIPLRELLAEAGAGDFGSVVVRSFQPRGSWRGARVNRSHALDPDTLLAMELNGEPLHLDHGYPVRLIAPNNPGVMQTKWVGRVIVE